MNSEMVLSHNISIHDRQKAELTGITEVESSNDTAVILNYSGGSISVEGENLRIESFNSETGKLSVIGLITGIFYFGKATGKKSSFSRLFKGGN